ncbi:MAG: DJ-1/PfpI family protein [Solobacterium sp.]|nr:DJ-1/PfpI family protein [Solobacterium sp.]
MSDKKAAVLLADGYEEGESLFLADILRRTGVACDTVSIEEEMVRGGHDMYVKADRLIRDVEYNDYDMVIIPGGMPGAANLAKSEPVLEWVRQFMNENKYVAAICAGPMVLKEAGVSTGRTLTSYPADKYRAMFADADYVDDNSKMESMVVTDGNLITSRGPATTFPFAFRLAEVLEGNVEQVKQGMLYNALCDSIRNA